MAGSLFISDCLEFVGNVALSVFHIPGGEPFYAVPLFGSLPEQSPYALQNHSEAQFFGRYSKIRFPPDPSDVL